MQPLVRAAVAVGVLMIVSGVATERVLQREAGPRPGAVRGDAPRMPCGPRELPEGDACVPIPRLAAASSAAPASSAAASSADMGAAQAADDEATRARIPRRPDRPADVRVLRLPITASPQLLDSPGAPALAGDADYTVLRLGAPRGTPVVAVALLGQEGPLEVVGVEPLPGRGLVVGALATTREGTRDERWLVLYGSLDGAGPGLGRGARLADGVVVGFAGDALTPGEPHVRFEARRLRPGVDPALPLSRLAAEAESIPVDARNILPPR